MKKTMILAMALILVGLMSVNGTFAFSLVDWASGLFSAGADRNTEVFQIDLVYLDRNGTPLKNQSAKPQLMPVYEIVENWMYSTTPVGEYDLWDSKKVVGATDRFVAVKNSSKTTDGNGNSVSNSAYFRIAFALQEEAYNLMQSGLLHLNLNTDDYTWGDAWSEITVGERKYRMNTATYQAKLAAGAVSPPAMLQIALDKDTTSSDIKALTDEFLMVKVLAIRADDFSATAPQGNETKAEAALNSAVPLSENFNPFIPISD